MRVWLLVDPEIPVPPRLYGGIERVVDLHARELAARGHAVTVFGHPDSSVPVERVAWPGLRSGSRADTLANTRLLLRRVRAEGSDGLVIHSFARLAYLTPLLPRSIATVQTYERMITPRSVWLGYLLSRGRLQFTACSGKCASSGDVVGDWHVVYNNVELSHYDFAQCAGDAPLIFLGRVERIKGPHHAIEVARRSGRRLILAGNLPEHGPDVQWARELVEGAGQHVEYVGPVDDAQKNALLGAAAALLMPIEWEEPFGIVMAEALACGTPVLGFRRGSVPEVVEHGRSGFVCRDLDEMVAAVGRLGEIDRRDCRRAAERRFGPDVIADAYEQVYRVALQAQDAASGGLRYDARP